MTGRIPFGLITLLAVTAWLPLQAQDSSGFLPEPSAQPQAAQTTAPQSGSYFGIPLNYDCPPSPFDGNGYPNSYYRELPEDSGLRQDETPLGKALLQKFRQMWFRPEYLNWEVSGPGNQLLGEQTASGVRKTYFGFGIPAAIPIDLLNAPNTNIEPGLDWIQPNGVTVNNVLGSTRTPDLSSLSIDSMNGFRGTFGVPVGAGQVELSGFLLATRSLYSTPASIFVPGTMIQGQIGNTDPFWTTGNPQIDPTFTGVYRFPDGTFPTANGLAPSNPHFSTFYTQVALVDGQRSDDPATAFINYDVSYSSKLVTSVWGTEGNYVFESTDPNSPFQVRPTVGFRYLNLRNRLDQFGQYYSDSTRLTVVDREINSSANNNFYGPQVGLRAEAVWWNFLVGFEPKVMLGLNTWRSELNTNRVFGPNDPFKAFDQHSTTFSPMVDLKGYTNILINNHLSFYFSYNFLWAGNVINSYNNFTYNNPSFFLNKNYSNTTIQGVSFGFDLQF